MFSKLALSTLPYDPPYMVFIVPSTAPMTFWVVRVWLS